MPRFVRFRTVDPDGTVTRLVSWDTLTNELTATYGFQSGESHITYSIDFPSFRSRRAEWWLTRWIRDGESIIPDWS